MWKISAVGRRRGQLMRKPVALRIGMTMMIREKLSLKSEQNRSREGYGTGQHLPTLHDPFR